MTPDSPPSILFKQQKVPSVKAISSVGPLSLSHASLLVTPLKSVQGYLCELQGPHCLLSLCVWAPREVSPPNRIKRGLVLSASEIPLKRSQKTVSRQTLEFWVIYLRLGLGPSLSPEPFRLDPAEHF